MTVRPAAFLVVGLLASVPVLYWPTAAKATTIDQSDTAGFQSAGAGFYSFPAGETFTPTLSGISFADFGIDALNGAGSADVTLIDGANGSGAVLGTSNMVNFSAYEDAPLEFDFPSTIALTPGTEYSLVFNSPNNPLLDYTNANVANSTGFVAGVPYGDFNFYFAEGVAAVPEPSTMGLLLAAVAALAAWCGRKRLSRLRKSKSGAHVGALGFGA